MATNISPAKILKLWNRVNDRFGPAEGGKDKGDKKKQSDKEKAAEKQNARITKGLTVLRNVSRGGVTSPSQVKKFEGTRDRVLLLMKKYCKLIKSTPLEGATDMNKFRKSVKQLTVVVADLNVLQLNSDEGDEDLNALTGVDTAQFDRDMEDPNFAAGDDNISFDDLETGDTESESEEVPTAPPTPPKSTGTPPPKVDLTPALTGWQTAREKAAGQLRQLATAIAGSKDPETKEALILVNAIIKNLTAKPDTPQAVKELESYLQADDIVKEAEIPNPWGVTVELRSPLLKALQPIKQALKV